MGESTPKVTHASRFWFVQALLVVAFGLLAARAFYLQVVNAEHLQREGDARHLRAVEIAASRGMILDRDGRPLAVSTPVESIWADPEDFIDGREHWPALARLLGTTPAALGRLAKRHAGREFMYLKRHVTPALAQRVKALGVPGVNLRREYRRYYPAGPMAAHVVGFTNIDDKGLEGLELAFDERLRGRPGRMLVLKDGRRHTVETVARLRPVVDGADLVVTLDMRIQYLAYRALQAAVAAHRAHSGSIVVLDSVNGEILAMANVPSFNPNNRAQIKGARLRNRAVSDLFEPGSTVKPFTIAAALESKKFGPDSRIETTPGLFKVGRYTIRDARDYGRLTLSHVIVKSSNVGTTKIALALDKRRLWEQMRRVGFGEPPGSRLPGEASGRLSTPQRWGPVEQATIGFGYGLSVTALQLARAYTAIANDGLLVPTTLVARPLRPAGRAAMSALTARRVRRMLELAVSDMGTGAAARIARYRVAGKTGTVHKAAAGGYARNRYISVFVGMAPVSRPRLVAVVVIDEPLVGGYFGGEVAAPVFSQVMAGALRLLNVAPDGPHEVRRDLAVLRGQGAT